MGCLKRFGVEISGKQPTKGESLHVRVKAGLEGEGHFSLQPVFSYGILQSMGEEADYRRVNENSLSGQWEHRQCWPAAWCPGAV